MKIKSKLMGLSPRMFCQDIYVELAWEEVFLRGDGRLRKLIPVLNHELSPERSGWCPQVLIGCLLQPG